MFLRIFLCLLFACCLPYPAFASGPRPLPVVVSIAPQKYILERIAGGNIQVGVLVTPGADPHSYEPGPSVMRDSANAKAWFTIGIAFEDIWRERIEKLFPGMQVISSIRGIKRLPYHFLQKLDNEDEKRDLKAAVIAHAPDKEPATAHGSSVKEKEAHSHTGEDPHVWLSPMLVREILPHLARELGRLIPDKATEFRANARAFSEELEKLDEELAKRFDTVPEKKRVFLTFHPSWQYFALNYQLKELSIEVDGKEPGPQSMKAVIDTAKTYGITTIFIEPQFSKSAARAVAQSIGAAVTEADPLAEDLPALYRDMADKLIHSFPE